MILFSLFAIYNELGTLYIAYMKDGKSLLTVEFYHPEYERWEESVLSELYTLDELLKWLELNYSYHEIFHMEIP
jgi:hypothetical protein